MGQISGGESNLGAETSRQNVHSTLFETKSEIDPHSRVLGILPRTLEIFRGIWSEVLN